MANLFVTSTSERSRRTAVIAEEIDSVWLYLSVPGGQRPECSCWLLNTPEAPADPRPRLEFYRGEASPPPLPASRMVDGPVPAPSDGEWTLVWSADGESVAALLNGQPIGFILAGQPRGVARYAMAGALAWGAPWDQASYSSNFERA